MTTYTYEVVTSNGAGVHSRHGRCADARSAMATHARAWSIGGDVFEIQRVEHIPGGGRRYQMRQRSRWVAWDPYRDHLARRPDWLATSGGRALRDGGL